nr:MAG TPA: hypothetical protein [Caudoviricetes sp.]
MSFLSVVALTKIGLLILIVSTIFSVSIFTRSTTVVFTSSLLSFFNNAKK